MPAYLQRLAQFTHLFHAVIARAVDLQHIHRTPLGDLHALGIVHVEIRFWAAGAIQCLGEDARDGRLARAAWSAKDVGVRDAILFDGVGECLGDVLLPNNVGESLWPILPRYDLV